MAPRKPKQPAKPTSAPEDAAKPKRRRAPKPQATKAPAKRGKAKPKKPAKVRKAAVETVVADVMPSPRAAWDERFISVAETILRMGGTDAQLAMALGCDIEDIAWWREEYPKFDAAFGRYAGMGVRGGRPTEYDAKFVAIARKLGELGATDLEVAQAFEVNIRTIYRWKLDHPEFAEALQSGKDVIDDAIEIALRKRAVGYTFDGEEIKVIDGEVIRVEKMEHVPPDPKAAMFWLQNRRPEKWRAVNRINLDVEKGGALAGFLAEISGQAIGPRLDPVIADDEEDEAPRAIGPKDDA
jgi:hypothetical protein